MAEGLNRVMLLGNLGADPELRYGQNAEQAVLRLRLATTESFMDRRTNERKERTDWHNVVVFGRRGEALQKILTKGSTIFVEGRLQTSSYDKDGQKHYRTDIIANNIILAGGRGAGAGAGAGAPMGPGAGAPREERPAAMGMRERPNFAAQGGGAPARAPQPPRVEDNFDDFGPANPGDDDIPF